MGKYLDKAISLRNDPEVHYNCAQTVLMAFAEKCGLSDAQAKNIAANFGGGMRTASICGAYTGALMVLGLLGMEDPAQVRELSRLFKEKHQSLECKDLLAASAARGELKKDHCDSLVYEMVSYLESVLL